MSKVIMDSKQQLVNDNGGGLVTLFLNENETMVTEQSQPNEDGLTENVEVTKYSYDMVDVHVNGTATEENVLQAVKNLTKEAIDAYDGSCEVNRFYIGEKELWIDRSTRTALMRRFEAEKIENITSTTLWYGVDNFKMAVDDAISMLNSLELYACQCYDVTASHKAAVDSLGTVEEAYNYNYKSGYPDKLSFDV